MQTLVNVNAEYYFNGDKITHSRYLELLNGMFMKDTIVSIYDDKNNVVLLAKIDKE